MSNGSVSFNDFFIKYILLVSAGMVYKMLISSYIFWREDERKKKKLLTRCTNGRGQKRKTKIISSFTLNSVLNFEGRSQQPARTRQREHGHNNTWDPAILH
jgi:hypothetical protein